MLVISPSLLSCDFANIASEISQIHGSDIWLHLDIMDGHFVPNLTFGQPIIESISKVSSFPLDAHLMVTNPSHYVEPLSKLNVHNFTFHWEAENHHDRLIEYAKTFFPSVGVALNPSTNINVIPLYLLERIDLLLIMTVNPGFGGQSFIEGAFNKISELSALRKKYNLKFSIQVDGGVSNLNCKRLKAVGADNLVAGSYIFKHPSKNYNTAISELR